MRGVFNRIENERRAEQVLAKAIEHVASTRVVTVGERKSADPAAASSTNPSGKFILGYSKLGGPDVLV